MNHSPIKTVLILANKDTTIIQFRLEVVAALVKAGYRVFVSIPQGTRTSEIEAVGATVIYAKLEKDSTDPIKDLQLLLAYRKLMRTTKPDVVLTYTIKPNVYGAMAAASLNLPCVANITGLGTALEGKGILHQVALMLYKVGFVKISKVFFQNKENMRFFEEHKIAIGRHELLPGSGVNLSRFSIMDYPDGEKINFAFVSRIRKEKGIEQYVDLARFMKSKYSNAYFHVCGYGSDEYEAYMKRLHEEGVIIYHGFIRDVRETLRNIHCVVHPTYYPEGMSNTLLESAASGRPIISTDRSGTRETIDDGINGYLVKERNSEDLIEKVEQFLNLTYEQKREMGLKGREKVEKEFDRNIVVRRYIKTVGELVGR